MALGSGTGPESTGRADQLASSTWNTTPPPGPPEPQPFILHRPFNTGLFFGLGLVIAAAASWLTFIIIASLLGVVVALS